ncbi:MAG: hypothetical protein ACK58M_04875 [Acidobacteriota bacterium]|jgi:hypothetical protein|nr:hypothetical protein [Bryobacteraceae bacterium CoA2 C42]
MISLLHRQIWTGELPPMAEPVPFPDPWPLPFARAYLSIDAAGGVTVNHRGPRYLGRLTPWQPTRILCPVRGGVEDYYVLLHSGARPATLWPTLTRDLT